MNTLAFGHRAIGAEVHRVEAEGEPTTHVLTAAQAHMKQMPLCKQKQLPAGQDPGACMIEARRVKRASCGNALQLVVVPAAVAIASEAGPSPHAPPTPDDEDILHFIIDDSI